MRLHKPILHPEGWSALPDYKLRNGRICIAEIIHCVGVGCLTTNIIRFLMPNIDLGETLLSHAKHFFKSKNGIFGENLRKYSDSFLITLVVFIKKVAAYVGKIFSTKLNLPIGKRG